MHVAKLQKEKEKLNTTIQDNEQQIEKLTFEKRAISNTLVQTKRELDDLKPVQKLAEVLTEETKILE